MIDWVIALALACAGAQLAAFIFDLIFDSGFARQDVRRAVCALLNAYEYCKSFIKALIYIATGNRSLAMMPFDYIFNWLCVVLDLYAYRFRRYFWGRVWPEMSRQCLEILAYCVKFYTMQDQRKNVFSQFFSTRRTAALRLMRGFIHSSKKPILMLRAFTRILVGDIIRAIRVSGSPRGTTLVRILFVVLCLIVFIGCGLLFLL